MNVTEVKISQEDVRRLLATASGDAAILYLYIQCGNDPDGAQGALGLSHSAFTCAAATLRQMGLWPQHNKAMIPTGERPNYTEHDVLEADRDMDFRLLKGEVQRVLDKFLNVEELKILL